MSKNGLGYREREILKIIAATSPFSFESIKFMYEHVHSFDKTIEITELSAKENISLSCIKRFL